MASFAVLATLLASTYFGVVLAIQSLRPAAGSLAVAISTLTIAAAFNPLRRRLQTAMERRFNRGHMDAQRHLEAFSQRTRFMKDTEALRGDIGRILDTSFAPSSIGIWLKS